MDLVQIRYFLALARTLNFTRAAEQCNVTQPALTKSIQRLEDELGGPLLLRERLLTQLTDLGRTMLPLLTETYLAAERAKEQAATLRRKPSRPLRLGFGPGVPVEPFCAVLTEIRRRQPALKLELHDLDEAGLVDGLLHGAIEVALLSCPAELPDRLSRWTLFRDPTVVVFAPGDPLARSAQVSFAALTERMLIGGAASPSGLPKPRHRTASLLQALLLVRAGFGVALATERALPDPLLPWCTLEPVVEQDVVLATVPGRPQSRAADSFVKLARASGWAAPERTRAA